MSGVSNTSGSGGSGVKSVVPDQKVIEYISALRQKWDIGIEHPERFVEIVATIALQPETLIDVAMVCTKEEYRREIAKLLISMSRAVASMVNSTRR